jgi:hypothetical protein
VSTSNQPEAQGKAPILIAYQSEANHAAAVASIESANTASEFGDYRTSEEAKRPSMSHWTFYGWGKGVQEMRGSIGP